MIGPIFQTFLLDEPLPPIQAFWMSIGIGAAITAVVATVVIMHANAKDRRKQMRNSSHADLRSKARLVNAKQEAAERAKRVELAFEAYYEQLFANHDFVNRNTTSLDAFIINENLNGLDIHKLAYLNKIKVECMGGWYDLILDLMRELDAMGWDRKVASIKEKFGELRFYAGSSDEMYDVIHGYEARSRSICEICGKPGELRTTQAGWMYTACEEHS